MELQQRSTDVTIKTVHWVVISMREVGDICVIWRTWGFQKSEEMGGFGCAGQYYCQCHHMR
jgi:hypothetical protein